MPNFTKIEGDEIVIRVPLGGIKTALAHRYPDLVVTDIGMLAASVVVEIDGEGMDEDLYLNRFLDDALGRAVGWGEGFVDKSEVNS